MQHVSFKNDLNKTLVGHLYRGASNAVIIMAHGFRSDKSSRGRFERLAHTFTQHGFNTLAFDFSGCGESDDEKLTAEKQVNDLQSAVNFVKSIGFERIAFYGHSLGSYICLRGWTPEIKTLVVSGALTDAMHYKWNEIFSKEQVSELKDKGYITDLRENGIRKYILIDQQMLLDFEDIDQKALLSRIKAPVLVIHGNHEDDEEEQQLLARSKKGMAYLSKESKLIVIDGATHSFFEHLNQLETLATEWFSVHMKDD